MFVPQSFKWLFDTSYLLLFYLCDQATLLVCLCISMISQIIVDGFLRFFLQKRSMTRLDRTAASVLRWMYAFKLK